MEYNEQIFIALMTGLPVEVDASDSHTVATAVRRRLRRQEVGMKAIDINIPRKSVTITPSNDGKVVLQLVARKIPQFEIIKEPSHGCITDSTAP